MLWATEIRNRFESGPRAGNVDIFLLFFFFANVPRPRAHVETAAAGRGAHGNCAPGSRGSRREVKILADRAARTHALRWPRRVRTENFTFLNAFARSLPLAARSVRKQWLRVF